MIDKVINIIRKHTEIPVTGGGEPENRAVCLFDVNVEDTGEELHDSHIITVESIHATSPIEAYENGKDCVKWLKEDLIKDKDISEVNFLTMYRDNDVVQKRYRYRITFSTHTY